MRKDVKKYMNSVVDILMNKYSMSEIESYKVVKKSFLYDSLMRFPDETLHDDIETNADMVYQELHSEELLRM